MAQIIIIADRSTPDGDPVTTWRERLTPPDMESSHFRRQLAERIAWAVGDADEVERQVERDERVVAEPELQPESESRGAAGHETRTLAPAIV